MGGLSSRGFLFPCIAVLKALGAEKIFITDGPRDQGIDIIARLEGGPLQSVALFVQVKTTKSVISRDTLLMEYAKYLALPHTKKYQLYRKALGLDSSVDGAAYCYMVMTNQGFARSSREIAAHLGILLRSRIQIAYWLVQKTTLDSLRAIESELGTDLPADLGRNLAPLFKL